jgi:uncharacterized protein YndB with AHSA1/START domain
MRDSVTVQMQASPEQVWALVSDVTRTGEFSPETFECEWLDGATGPEVGARFRGHVNRNNSGVKYWTVCTVVESVPGQAFAFTVGAGNRVINTWRYDLAPVDGGTAVTESFALDQNVLTSLYWKVAGTRRGKTNRDGMRTTLERIKAVVETA